MRSFLKKCSVLLTVTLVGLVGAADAKTSLNGMTVYEELGEERFIAALYTETPSRDAHQVVFSDEPKAMEMRFVGDRIYPRQFKRLWIEGVATNAGQQELERFSESLAEFGNMLTVKLRAGDVVRIDRGDKVEVRVNGYLLGTIDDPAFFDLLLRTWIGPVPPAGKFREELLRAGDVPTSISRRFDTIEPSPERIAAVAKALDKAKIAAAPQASQPAPKPVVPVVAPKAAMPEPVHSSSPAVQPKPAPQPAPEPKPEPQPEPQIAAVAPLPHSVPIEEPAANDEEEILESADTERLTAELLLMEQVYISMISKWTQKHIKYPRMAVKHNQEGVVHVTLTLAPNGEVQNMEFRVPSDHDALNKAARKAVYDASPYPEVPAELASAEFVVNMPVVFVLR